MSIEHYLNDDGANWQARCVLVYLSSQMPNLEVVRYKNCREQGYIFYKSIGNQQMNVAVYEHRNSDALCIVSFEKFTGLSSPKAEDVWENMEDKWDTTDNFDCGDILNCGDTIIEMFQEFEESLK